jgi:hypothetical protein
MGALFQNAGVFKDGVKHLAIQNIFYHREHRGHGKLKKEAKACRQRMYVKSKSFNPLQIISETRYYPLNHRLWPFPSFYSFTPCSLWFNLFF